MVRTFEKVLTFIEENFVYFSLLLMLAIVFSNFVLRYLFGASLTWGEELARYLMIWATFIAASLGVKKGAHITLDILVIYLPEKANKILRATSYICCITYCILVLYIGIPFINSLIEKNQLSPALQIPMSIVYLSIIVGTILMLLRYILLFITDIINNEKIEKPEIFAD